jgi:hypothetical protein
MSAFREFLEEGSKDLKFTAKMMDSPDSEEFHLLKVGETFYADKVQYVVTVWKKTHVMAKLRSKS